MPERKTEKEREREKGGEVERQYETEKGIIQAFPKHTCIQEHEMYV